MAAPTRTRTRTRTRTEHDSTVDRPSIPGAPTTIPAGVHVAARALLAAAVMIAVIGTAGTSLLWLSPVASAAAGLGGLLAVWLGCVGVAVSAPAVARRALAVTDS